MILVLNKKNGVGSSLISYNLSRLYSLPLFTTETNFMRSKDNRENFPTVKSIPKSYKKGIYDVGSHNLTKTLTHKILLNTKLLIVPFELGYESTIKAIETVKYIQDKKTNIKVLLILNRLDKHDDERDFNYTQKAKDILEKEGIILGHSTEHDNDNIHLTYLRNSYSLFSHAEDGKFFLDKMYKENLVFDKLKDKMPISFNYWYFIYLASFFVCSDKYLDDTVYNQTKDIVTFRTDYERFISAKSRVYLNNLSKEEKKEYQSFSIQHYNDYNSNQNIDKNTFGKILSFKIHNIFLEKYRDIELGINKEEGYEKSLFSLIQKNEYPHSFKLKPNILEVLTDNIYFKNKEPKLLKDLAFITYAIDNLLMMAE